MSENTESPSGGQRRGRGGVSRKYTPPAPLADGGEILTRERFRLAVSWLGNPEHDDVLAHDAALRAEVERLRAIKDESPAFAAALARAEKAERERDRWKQREAESCAEADLQRRRAEKLAEALRKALAELTHANSNAGTRAEVAVIAARALAENGEEK